MKRYKNNMVYPNELNSLHHVIQSIIFNYISETPIYWGLHKSWTDLFCTIEKKWTDFIEHNSRSTSLNLLKLLRLIGTKKIPGMVLILEERYWMAFHYF